MQNDNFINNFGFIRLFFASLVIFSHSPELIDGNRSREILTILFGTLSLGELAVDGFFLVSGYLIVKSFLNTSSLKSYLFKRVLRIYPAFVISSLVCIFIFAPFSIGMSFFDNFEITSFLKSFLKILFLSSPEIEGTKVFALNHYPILNGAVWTIRYEFFCYLCVPVLAYFGFFKKNYLFLILVISFFYLITLLYGKNISALLSFNPHKIIRLLLAFLVGGYFYLNAEKIKWNKWIALLMTILLLIFLNFPLIAELGLLVFGGYLIFFFSLEFKNKILNQIGSKNDISYGLYLYAWPVQSLIIQFFPNVEPYQVNLVTLLLACNLGFISWKLIEKPCLNLKGRF